MRERLFCMESPTHVGNTHGVLRRGSAPAVHPHACGEYNSYTKITWFHIGSSPRVWGILARAVALADSSRFIPTRVGNTPPDPPDQFFLSVHPHACGEYGKGSISEKAIGGSSPRVWGIHSDGINVPLRYRFIPTRVGNTLGLMVCMVRSPVHPHACGEYRSATMS